MLPYYLKIDIRVLGLCQQWDDLLELNKGARPAVKEEKGSGFLIGLPCPCRRFDMLEMNLNPENRGFKLQVFIEELLPRSPVVLGEPITRQTLEEVSIEAILESSPFERRQEPIRVRRRLSLQPPLQVNQDLLLNLDCEGADGSVGFLSSS